VAQLETYFVSAGISALNFVLGDRAWLVFHFDLQVFRRDDAGGETQDMGELPCREPVIGVTIPDPGLEETGLLTPNAASAIDEGLNDMSDLGDVELSRNRVAIR
jgi:hypothetical protein